MKRIIINGNKPRQVYYLFIILNILLKKYSIIYGIINAILVFTIIANQIFCPSFYHKFKLKIRPIKYIYFRAKYIYVINI